MSAKVTIASSTEQLAILEPLWHRCFETDRYASIFQHFAWNLAAVRHHGDRERPYVIAVEHDGDATIIPAGIIDGACTLIGEELGDYRSVLTTDQHSCSFERAWCELAQLNLPLRFTALRSEHHAIFDSFSTHDFVGAPYLTNKSAEQFVHEHNRMFSRLRKLQRLGFEVRQREKTDSELLRWIYRNKAAADPQSLFHDSARVDMLLEAIAALPADVVTIERDSHIISAAVAFQDRRWLRFYTNWYDLEWARYSPGMVLLYEMTRRALTAGLSCDYLTGEQSYKLRMASNISYLRRIDASVEELRHAVEFMRSPSVASSV
jgi:CelD/BcsL family acetyltransferase involved in cellulose biosynthesis